MCGYVFYFKLRESDNVCGIFTLLEMIDIPKVTLPHDIL